MSEAVDELTATKKELKQWKGVAIAALIFLIGFALLVGSNLKDAELYQSYNGVIPLVLNGTYKLEPSNAICSQVEATNFTFNMTGG